MKKGTVVPETIVIRNWITTESLGNQVVQPFNRFKSDSETIIKNKIKIVLQFIIVLKVVNKIIGRAYGINFLLPLCIYAVLYVRTV